MIKCIAKIFNLQGYILYKISVKAREVSIWIGRPKKESMCPYCGSLTKRVHSKAKKERRIFHGFAMGKRVWLVVRARRFRCKCGRTHTERFPGIVKWKRQSESGMKTILRMLSKESFNTVSKKTGMSYGTLKKILLMVRPLSWKSLLASSPDGFLYLGIDDHSFRGQNLVITVTELKQRKLLQILPDDRKKTLKEFLFKIPSYTKERIKEVCIDMKAGYLEAIKEELPSASVVVDPFHVIEDANRRVDEARKIEQEGVKERIPKRIFLIGKEKVKSREGLEYWLKRYPTIKEFYEMKERLREMFKMERREEAERKLSFAIAIAEESEDVEMGLWAKTLRKWRPYILNHFKSETTNAYTEGVHTKIKLLKRISYGFRNVEVYVKP